MGTTLTPDFWKLFAVLLVIAMAVTFVVSAVLDALTLRMLRRRAAHGRSPGTRATDVSHRSGRTPVRH
ncbi:hypothetical protein ACKI1I_15600 [Streptomyces turgidiscabies]|uniref:Uncharacterized protein n=1 Tax=Streptomyces turgidiscabies (strain Car8) TaxID=698760 RepID=L7FD02_STRT8|nr:MULTISPECIES: hypothetical protein [Streptomyces]ELP69127.1 hypothetical protein STRTUCAR8_08227 [Streptomyces turgidiscabies Car8]MDX3495252.1 hypothetical protein [Streptomyces turgidiscabies]GAQ71130.1 hypothetical protein T45_02872 [Streptomyces turgidiscabies]